MRRKLGEQFSLLRHGRQTAGNPAAPNRQPYD
jgi:hypothetical protein